MWLTRFGLGLPRLGCSNRCGSGEQARGSHGEQVRGTGAWQAVTGAGTRGRGVTGAGGYGGARCVTSTAPRRASMGRERGRMYTLGLVGKRLSEEGSFYAFIYYPWQPRCQGCFGRPSTPSLAPPRWRHPPLRPGAAASQRSTPGGGHRMSLGHGCDSGSRMHQSKAAALRCGRCVYCPAGLLCSASDPAPGQ